MNNNINYSYVKLDLIDYLPSYINNRIQAIESIKNDIYTKYNNFNQICVELEKLTDGLNNKRIDDSTIDILTFLVKQCKSIRIVTSPDYNSLKNIFIIQKKFEVFKKLFSRYDKNKFVKATNIPASLEVYILLSIILNIIHYKTINYNSFNTSSKLIDFCLTDNHKYTDERIRLLECAIGLEMILINNFIIDLK